MSDLRRTNRQVARSRMSLQTAFLALLKQKPFKRITISEIAEKADLARSTFYAHFESKRELLSSYVDDIFDPFLQAILERDTVPAKPEPHQIELEEQLCKLWKDNAEALTAIVDAGQELIILEHLQEVHQTIYHRVIMKHWGHLGAFFGEYITAYVAGTHFSILVKWLEVGFHPSAETIARYLFALTGPANLRAVMNEFSPRFAEPA